MKRIAIILARGGSKRLPRKNILDFHGKPLLAWTVEAAIHSGQFDRVLVSTDDPEIAKVAIDYGGEAPFLRTSAADDITPSSEATIVALGQAEQHWGEKFDVVSQLMANCPLRDASDISAAVRNFMDSGAPAQVSCFRFGWMNPWWAFKLNAAGGYDRMFPEAWTSRSQDLPHLYCPSGALWIARADALRAARTFYMPSHTFHELTWMSAMDIDDADDLKMAKACHLIKEHG